MVLFISIHAPTKGATTGPQGPVGPAGFQSTLPRRERPLNSDGIGVFLNFNPRSHEGSDARPAPSRCRYRYFNPRSHEGSDFHRQYDFQNDLFISIHAPTKGATILKAFKEADCLYFNPRSHEGSDCYH